MLTDDRKPAEENMKTPFDNYELIAAELTDIGWDSPGDAQWDGLKMWCADKAADFKISNLQKVLSTLSNVTDERVETVAHGNSNLPPEEMTAHSGRVNAPQVEPQPARDEDWDNLVAYGENQAAQIAQLREAVKEAQFVGMLNNFSDSFKTRMREALTSTEPKWA